MRLFNIFLFDQTIIILNKKIIDRIRCYINNHNTEDYFMIYYNGILFN